MGHISLIINIYQDIGPRRAPSGGSVLDAAVVLRGSQLLVFAHPIKFEQPVLKAVRHVQLAGADFSGRGVQGNDRLGPGAAGAGADRQ